MVYLHAFVNFLQTSSGSTVFYKLLVGVKVHLSDASAITDPLIKLQVGRHETLSCTTDLDIVTIEWVLVNGNEVVVTSTDQQADLVFAPVNDTLHLVEFKCIVTSPYGTQEKTITLEVDGINSVVLVNHN